VEHPRFDVPPLFVVSSVEMAVFLLLGRLSSSSLCSFAFGNDGHQLLLCFIVSNPPNFNSVGEAVMFAS